MQAKNDLKPGHAIVTLSHLFRKHLGHPLKEELKHLSSDKKRIAYLAEETAAITGLREFPEYLTLLFEIDSLVLNDDRHLDNIAVIEQNGRYDYCPIFDQGAGLLSNVQLSPMDILPSALIRALRARPFHMTFNRQLHTVQELYGKQLRLPGFTRGELMRDLRPLLGYYASRDRGLIADRVCDTILMRQKEL